MQVWGLPTFRPISKANAVDRRSTEMSSISLKRSLEAVSFPAMQKSQS